MAGIGRLLEEMTTIPGILDSQTSRQRPYTMEREREKEAEGQYVASSYSGSSPTRRCTRNALQTFSLVCQDMSTSV